MKKRRKEDGDEEERREERRDGEEDEERREKEDEDEERARRKERRREERSNATDQQIPSMPPLAPHTHPTMSLLQEGNTRRKRSSARGRSPGCWRKAEIPVPAF